MTRKTALRCIAGLFLAAGPLLSACADYHLDPPPADQIRAAAGEVVDPREIVALLPGPAAAERLRDGARAQGFVLREARALPGLDLQMLRFEIPPRLDGPAAIVALEAIEPDTTAGVNHAYAPAVGTPLAGLDYAAAMMRWPDRPCPARGPIGIIDTRVDASVPELAAARIHSADFTRGPSAPNRHGTEVAAVLADPQRLSGVTLYSAAVVANSARGRQETGVDGLLAALDWMAQHHVRLVNISLSGPYNKLLDRGIDAAAARGITIVAAVGNAGAAAGPRYPAALGNVIAVTALDAQGAIYDRAVQGPQVDVAAPGVDVVLHLRGRPVFVTGTSIAAPFATARIAADPTLYGARTDRLRAGLAASSRDLGRPGRDPVFGSGLLLASQICAAP